MKWCLLLLLAANIIYYGWELDREASRTITNARQGIRVPDAVKRLSKLDELWQAPPLREQDGLLSIGSPDNSVRAQLLDALGAAGEGLISLVSEPTDEQTSEQQGEQASAVTSDKYSCFYFGPIPDKKIAQALHDWFQSRNLISEIAAAGRQRKQLFWVYLAPVKDRARAIDLLTSLADKGVRDYRLIRQGELNNAISLGLFSSRAAVNTRLGELQRQGLAPVVVPYSDVKMIYQVNVRLLNAPAVLDAVFGGFPAGFNSIPVSCGAP